MARQNLKCRHLERKASRRGNKDRDKLLQAVMKLTGANDESDPDQRAAMVLVGARIVGPDVDRLVRLTGYAQEYVEQVALRLRNSGLWKEHTLDYGSWEGEKGICSFAFDLMVATGKFVRGGKAADGQYKFRLLKSGD